MAEARHLAQSALCAEDVFDGGHTAVWGSHWDSDAKRWGYACCKVTARAERCPFRAAQGSAVDAGAESSGDEAQVRAAVMAEHKVRSSLTGTAPEQLALRSTFGGCDEDYLREAAVYWYHAWAGCEEHRPDAKIVQQTQQALIPLLAQLDRRAVQPRLLQRLADFIDLAGQREYAKANDVYLDITIGKSKWHTDMDLGEGRAHWAGGGNLRTWQRQTIDKDLENQSLFDSDPVVQRYVHALKRFVTHMQQAQPSADPSKMGHALAPVPAAHEVGLPVQQNIRDSDGRANRTREGVDPSEMALGPRGIAFGQRTDSTGQRVPGSSRNMHPFAA